VLNANLEEGKTMKTGKSFYFIALVLLSFALTAFGKTDAEIEQELIGHIKNIQKWSSNGSDSNDEKPSKENDIFKEKLLNYTKIASTLEFKFSELHKYLYLATSEDGKFRIYSWDTEGGGSMHFFENVYQFQGKDGKVYSKGNDLPEGDAGAFVSDIFDVDTGNGKVYLARFSSILSNKDAYQSINLFKIEDNSLNDKIKLIKTKSGLTNKIGFEYDFFSVVDKRGKADKTYPLR